MHTRTGCVTRAARELRRPGDDARPVAAEDVARHLDDAPALVVGDAVDEHQRRADAQPERRRLVLVGEHRLDALDGAHGRGVEALAEQLVEGAGQVELEQAAEALGGKARALERERLAVGEAHAHDLDRVVRRSRAETTRAPAATP